MIHRTSASSAPLQPARGVSEKPPFERRLRRRNPLFGEASEGAEPPPSFLVAGGVGRRLERHDRRLGPWVDDDVDHVWPVRGQRAL